MIASHIADRFSILGQSAVILDAFAGCGGNTIQFAKVFDKGENSNYNKHYFGICS